MRNYHLLLKSVKYLSNFVYKVDINAVALIVCANCIHIEICYIVYINIKKDFPETEIQLEDFFYCGNKKKERQ